MIAGFDVQAEQAKAELVKVDLSQVGVKHCDKGAIADIADALRAERGCGPYRLVHELRIAAVGDQYLVMSTLGASVPYLFQLVQDAGMSHVAEVEPVDDIRQRD